MDQYESMFFTTDGSTPSFYKAGMLDEMIRMAIESGVPPIDAYQMASYNVAGYYNLQHLHGMIGTGRIANINFLENEWSPSPISVLAKGQWIRRDGKPFTIEEDIQWQEYGIEPLALDWELTEEDLQFSMPFGVEMINSVITKPYSVVMESASGELPDGSDELFFALLDRKGKWRSNTMLKGFAKDISGFVSSFSTTGDIIFIGKNKEDMRLAFNRMKEIGGGIVLSEGGKVIYEIALPLAGLMSDKELPGLMEEEGELRDLLIDRGYAFTDPIYSLFFLSSTHLPYIRVTQRGMYDVMNKTVLFPTLMR